MMMMTSRTVGARWLAAARRKRVAAEIVVDVKVGVAEFELLLVVVPLSIEGCEVDVSESKVHRWELVEVVQWVLACVVDEVGSVVVVLVWGTMEGQD